MAKKIEDMLGSKKPEDELKPGLDPATATPDGNEEGNPLEKMDEISKATPQKSGTGSTTLDEDVVTQMFKTGENTDGMFTPKDEEEHEEEDKEAKVKVGSKVVPSDKYKNKFKDDMLKHPDEYKVMTPRGEMTVKEALRAGYNPITKRFEKGHGQDAIKEKHLSQLNDADREAIEGLTDPAAAQIAPADAEKYGIPAGSPMIKQPENEMPMMHGMGTPTPTSGTPLGAAMPGSEESMAPGATDISALLGGGQ